MFDGKANIDLVFRNGLKDYEVSPPPDVWENIPSAIGRKKKYMLLWQSAAAIAVIVSVGALAYMWGYETSKEKFTAELVNVNMINEPATPIEIPITAPLVAIHDRTESATETIANIKQEEFEPEVVPIVDKLEILYAVYADNSNVDISKRLVAGIESFSVIQEPLTTKGSNVFLPDLQSIIYNDIYYESVAAVEDNRWSILAMASPTYYSQFTTSSNELSHQIKASDQGKASYSGGVGFSYKINGRLSIQSGLYYSAIGQELGNITAHSGFAQVNPSKGSNNFKVLTANGTVSASNPDIYLGSTNVPDRMLTKYTLDVLDPVKANLNYLSNSIFQDLSYLELPLLLRFKAIDRKMGLSFVGGLSYNFLVNNSVYVIDGGGKIPVGTTEGVSNLSLSSSLGMGMEYKISKNLSFNIEPTFRYFINSNADRIVGLHSYALGIFSGVAYKF